MPWAVLNLADDRGELHRVLAYGYGCTVILIGFVLWALMQAQTMPIVSVWLAVVFLIEDMAAAFCGIMLPRVIRWIHELRTLRDDVANYEQAIET